MSYNVDEYSSYSLTTTKMEVASSLETLVPIYEYSLRHIE